MADENNPYQTPSSKVADDVLDTKKEYSGTALASGIIALIALFLPVVGVRVGFLWWTIIVALCTGLGIHGLINISRNQEKLKGKGFAIWGLVYSCFIVFIAILAIAGVL